MGCAVIDGEIPRSLDDAFNGQGVTVEVLNVLGAGDAFASGFLYGYLQGWPLERAVRLGNACGAIIVTRHGCANFMPTLDEVTAFLAERGEAAI
jgi:5-dehydro-2-deoxygluconokinase